MSNMYVCASTSIYGLMTDSIPLQYADEFIEHQLVEVNNW